MRLITPENQYKRTIYYSQLTVLNGNTDSDIISCGGMQAIALDFPSNWTACNISFYKSQFPFTDLNFQLYNIKNIDGSVLSIPTNALDSLPLVPYLFIGAGYLQIVCDAPQAVDAIVNLVLQPIFQGVHG